MTDGFYPYWVKTPFVRKCEHEVSPKLFLWPHWIYSSKMVFWLDLYVLVCGGWKVRVCHSYWCLTSESAHFLAPWSCGMLAVHGISHLCVSWGWKVVSWSEILDPGVMEFIRMKFCHSDHSSLRITQSY